MNIYCKVPVEPADRAAHTALVKTCAWYLFQMPAVTRNCVIKLPWPNVHLQLSYVRYRELKEARKQTDRKVVGGPKCNRSMSVGTLF